jgi:hypothetical protein
VAALLPPGRSCTVRLLGLFRARAVVEQQRDGNPEHLLALPARADANKALDAGLVQDFRDGPAGPAFDLVDADQDVSRGSEAGHLPLFGRKGVELKSRTEANPEPSARDLRATAPDDGEQMPEDAPDASHAHDLTPADDPAPDSAARDAETTLADFVARWTEEQPQAPAGKASDRRASGRKHPLSERLGSILRGD